MTEPRWDSAKRDSLIEDDDRGPDSVECSPFNNYPHHMCILDYREIGFVCGCGCHDVECYECGGANGDHESACHRPRDKSSH